MAVVAHDYIIAESADLYSVSGTSASTPVFAGMVSLVNGRRLAAGKSSLGWLNPAIYTLYHKFANDITEGDNNCAAGADVCCSSGYNARAGWDPVTGVGSVNFTAFSDVLFRLGDFPFVPTPLPTPGPGEPSLEPVEAPTEAPSQAPVEIAEQLTGWFAVSYFEGDYCSDQQTSTVAKRTNLCITETTDDGVVSSQYTCDINGGMFCFQFY